MIGNPALDAEAKTFHTARLAAMTRRMGQPVAEPSAAPLPAPASASPLGEHGAIALREISTGGVTYPRGSYIPPETTRNWRRENVAQLARSKRVVFLSKPLTAPAPEPVVDDEVKASAHG
jgi:hypothetical protein